jgi:hypothetical protein
MKNPLDSSFTVTWQASSDLSSTHPGSLTGSNHDSNDFFDATLLDLTADTTHQFAAATMSPARSLHPAKNRVELAQINRQDIPHRMIQGGSTESSVFKITYGMNRFFRRRSRRAWMLLAYFGGIELVDGLLPANVGVFGLAAAAL